MKRPFPSGDRAASSGKFAKSPRKNWPPGMLEILKQNVTAEKTGLYRFLAAQCGVTRLGKAVTEAMDEALALLQDQVVIDGEQVSLK